MADLVTEMLAQKALDEQVRRRELEREIERLHGEVKRLLQALERETFIDDNITPVAVKQKWDRQNAIDQVLHAAAKYKIDPVSFYNSIIALTPFARNEVLKAAVSDAMAKLIFGKKK